MRRKEFARFHESTSSRYEKKKEKETISFPNSTSLLLVESYRRKILGDRTRRENHRAVNVTEDLSGLRQW